MKARKKLIRKPKDAQADREAARRFAANLSLALLVVGAVAGLIVMANRWGAKEGLHSVRIVGRKVLDSAEVMERAQIPPGVPLSRLDLAQIESRIAANPFIARTAVYRGENGTLVVEIAERTPVAVTFIEGAPVYLDSQAVALPHRFSSATFDVPVVGGIAQGARIDSARALEVLGLVRSVRDHDQALFRQISEIRREADGEYTFFSADGAVPIRAGYPADIPGRLDKLDLFWRTVLAARGVDQAGYIDLRWKGQVVVRWKTQALAM